MDDPAIYAHNLSKSFGGRSVVEALDLDVPAGSVFGLLGPNGAGKTTTVRMLTGMIAPSAGDAVVAGQRVSGDEASLSRLHAKIGLLTEAPGMWERLSATRNLRVYAELHTLPDPAAVVERYLRLVDLWDRRADAAGKLSRGMRQRLAIARALLHEPPVLFLDEPTSGLDPEAAGEVRDLIGRLRGEGRAILLCTHNLEEAEKLSDRIGIFECRMLASGTAGELRRQVFGAEIIARFAPPDAPDRHLRAAGGLPEARTMRCEGDALVLGVDEPDAALPGLARALVADGADIVHLGERTRSLEEVYFDVIGRGAR